MNKRKYIINGMFFSILVMGFSSCLKNRNGDINLTDAKRPGQIAEISQPGFHAVVFDFTTTPQNVNAYVSVVAPQPLGSDITVTLALDPTALADYNTANGTSYELPASNAYSIKSFAVTVKKGVNLDSLQIIVYPDKVDLTKQLAIPIKISDASGLPISANFRSAIYSIGVKNKYDAIYGLRIQTIGWAAYGIADGVTYDYPKTADGRGMGLLTAGISSVDLFDYYRSDYLQPAFTAGGGATAFGATSPRFTFDPATNLLTSVVNTTPNDGRGRAFLLNPNVTDSRFDPATKTIYAAYIMKQNGRPDQKIYDTLSYIMPR